MNQNTVYVCTRTIISKSFEVYISRPYPHDLIEYVRNEMNEMKWNVENISFIEDEGISAHVHVDVWMKEK